MTFFKRLLGHDAKAQALPRAPKQQAFGVPKWHPSHRHRKGGNYRLLGFGINESDRSEVAIYDDESGKVWVRSRLEFEDGRFRPITLEVPNVSAVE